MGEMMQQQSSKQEADVAGDSMSAAAAAQQQHPPPAEPSSSSRPKWSKQWVPFDTVLNPGKCALLKWVNDDMLKALKDKYPQVEPEPEEKYEVLYLCSFEGCGKAFTDQRAIKKHIQIHGEKQFVCHYKGRDDMLKTLKDKYPQAEPEPEEEFEVLYLCNFEGCGKAFTDQGALRKHTHIHGEKQFVCHYEGCGKRFMDSSKLKRHFLIHTGERSFVCPVEGCGKAFSLDFNLRSHMRTHTQENYHICPFEDCRKRYAHEYKLRAHLKSCHEKVIPPEVRLTPPVPPVEREVAMPRAVATPAASVNLERPFACPYEGCDKRYIHEYKLNLHLRKEHAQEENAEEISRVGRRTDAEDDMDEGSEKEPNGKVGVIRGSGRGKLRIISKPPTVKTSRRKPVPSAPVEMSFKIQGGSRTVRRKEVPKKEVDSEETEEEDQEDTEDEDLGRMMQPRMGSEDDEETEDDME